MELSEDEYLAHYGILRRSGRYPWGSGEDQPTRNRTFLQTIDHLKSQGLTDEEIRKSFSTDDHPISTTQWRAVKSIAKNQVKAAERIQAERLRANGLSNVAIGEKMGKPESSVRALLAPGAKERTDILISTADMLRKEVDDKKYVDVGRGVENYINQGISQERLRTATAMLQEEGYELHKVKLPQIGTAFDTETKVLAAPGTPWKEVNQNRFNLGQITAVTEDRGRTYSGPKWHEPIAINPNRVAIKYKEDGGDKMDGVIHVRPGVPDVSLGKAQYAQVRIKVGDGHYLKGMAVYKDNMPNGVDLVFNTNKSKNTPKDEVMKPLTSSKDYPFKTVVRQQLENVGQPSERVTSAMNIVYEQGDWGKWSKSLSSQVLSKQSPTLARSQLAVTFERRQKEFEDIQALTNPTIKKKLLESFAEGTDASAVHLSAAAMSTRQRWHAILPLETIKPGEIYAPNYDDGERVVLIRHPHAGTFEIPELTVNNRHPEGRRVIGPNAEDAVGIHHTVAQHLSGADFDGDTVIVIPNNPGSRRRISISPMLEQLKGFDPQMYKIPEGSDIPKITPTAKQHEMGYISNLITDMTIKRASHEEISRAVKHSMVVIDSEKHGLNYKQSALDHGIAQLKTKYQGAARAGASTLISKSESEKRVPHRKGRLQGEGGPVDRVTGEKHFVDTGLTTVNKKGVAVPKMTITTKGAEAKDAHELSSGTIMEGVYADHANKLKGLANQARLEALNTPLLQRSDSARRVYANQVQSLNAQLILAKKNAVLERRALAIANSAIRAKRDANPELEGDALKKIRFEEMNRARNATGAKKKLIEISDEEWNAIQAGAISNSQLIQILNNTDVDKLRAKATPRAQRVMSTAMTQRAKAMLGSNYTRGEVAKQLGVSLSTLDASINPKEQKS